MSLIIEGRPIKFSYYHVDTAFYLNEPRSTETAENAYVLKLYNAAKDQFSHIEDVAHIMYRLVDLDEMLWDLMPPGLIGEPTESLVQAIVKYRRNYTHIIDDIYTWPVYLGLLALARLQEFEQVYEFLEDHFEYEHKEFKPYEQLSNYTAGAEEALDAIWYIKYLDELETHRKTTLSERNRKSANAGHRPRDEIKQAFVHSFIKNDGNNKSEAARKYYRSLSREDKRILCPSLIKENATRTLINALNDWLGGK
jgi:hypothetical protein